jgi:hypothetical protein
LLPWRWEILPIESATGHFLTGDIDLKENNYFQEFKNHFSKEIFKNFKPLDKSLLFQVPHHGSIENWNTELLFSLPKSLFFVISTGYLYSGHPNPLVIADIIRENRYPIIVDKNNTFIFVLKK